MNSARSAAGILPCPFDEGHVAKIGERRPRAEVPGLERDVEVIDSQPAALSQAPILLRRQWR